jgi:hypothetical protein
MRGDEMMDVRTLIFRDIANYYEADGTTLLYANEPCLFLHLPPDAQMTPSGAFDRSRCKNLLAADKVIPVGGKVEVVQAAAYDAGDIFVVESASQKAIDPRNRATAHHQNLILIKEQH